MKCERDLAIRAAEMAADGQLVGWTEARLTDLLGPPTARYADSVIWSLHPHVWDGCITLWKSGEVSCSYDQGGSI